ncbi:MAG: glycogen synthase [Chloroflexi bacterium]|nr:MAG: glycogen synthase [Chloroflexota bacterium]
MIRSGADASWRREAVALRWAAPANGVSGARAQRIRDPGSGCPRTMAAVRVAMIAAECEPWAKIGGLGDVVDALARALPQVGAIPADRGRRRGAGLDRVDAPVDVLLPLYRGVELPPGEPDASAVHVADPLADGGTVEVRILTRRTATASGSWTIRRRSIATGSTAIRTTRGGSRSSRVRPWPSCAPTQRAARLRWTCSTSTTGMRRRPSSTAPAPLLGTPSSTAPRRCSPSSTSPITAGFSGGICGGSGYHRATGSWIPTPPASTSCGTASSGPISSTRSARASRPRRSPGSGSASRERCGRRATATSGSSTASIRSCGTRLRTRISRVATRVPTERERRPAGATSSVASGSMPPTRRRCLPP